MHMGPKLMKIPHFPMLKSVCHIYDKIVLGKEDCIGLLRQIPFVDFWANLMAWKFKWSCRVARLKQTVGGWGGKQLFGQTSTGGSGEETAAHHPAQLTLAKSICSSIRRDVNVLSDGFPFKYLAGRGWRSIVNWNCHSFTSSADL